MFLQVKWLLKGKCGYFLAWALFPYLFGSKFLLGTKTIEICPVLSQNTITSNRKTPIQCKPMEHGKDPNRDRLFTSIAVKKLQKMPVSTYLCGPNFVIDNNKWHSCIIVQSEYCNSQNFNPNFFTHSCMLNSKTSGLSSTVLNRS